MALLDLSSSIGTREENGSAGPFLPMAFRYIGSRRTFLTAQIMAMRSRPALLATNFRVI